MYFIADDYGNIYAHDIRSRGKARAILASILEQHPEYKANNLEVLDDSDDEVEGINESGAALDFEMITDFYDI